MRDSYEMKWRVYLEIVLHLAYWLFHFASVQTNWAADWSDRSVRDGVAQVTIILFPFIFYLNAFWLIPKYLKGNRWYRYFAIALMFTLSLEVIRTLAFVLHRGGELAFETAFAQEFMSQDNLLFGLPNTLVSSFIFSTVYRFTRDWIIHQRLITHLQLEKIHMMKKLEAFERSLKYQQEGESGLIDRLTDVVQQKNGTYKNTFQAKRRDETYLLKSDTIVYVKAQGDFVTAMDFSGSSYIINHTLAVMEEYLDPLIFYKINRGEIVNASYILKYTNHTKNRLEIFLKGIDNTLFTSNSRTPGFRKWLEEI